MTNIAFEPDNGSEIAEQRAPIMLENVRPIPRISIQAFCENESVAIPIERAGNDRRMAKTHLKVSGGGIEAAIEFYQTASTPNLIIVESSSEPSILLDELQRLSEVCDPGSKVLVIGHSNEVWLYRELLRRGVSEYIVAPVSLADVLAIVSSIFLDPGAEPLGRSIAVIGAKGGVGASTIAHNVAWSISNLFRHDVVLADMDLPFGTANINFDQDPTLGIADAVFSPERVDEVYLDRLLVQYGEHLSILAAPSSLERTFDFQEDAFSEIIDVAQRTSPLVVLDLAHGWNGWTRTTLMRADEVVIVAAPDLANLRNTKNLLDTLAQLRPNDLKPHLVLNQVGVPKRPEIALSDFSEPLGIDPIAAIEFEPQLFGNAANTGRMIAETSPDSPVSATITHLAHVLTGRADVQPRKKNGISGLLGKFARKTK
ncbi:MULTISPECIES: AAA family ATPase [Brucella/Ochrobactrum group]|uniref:AAA family ATPase n=1 Tax=Ochrobactrum soli TaxID=2448455 RepID=A0A849KI46_9HYPH|nr:MULTISPECIES: CpaE family protein [Brucella]MCI0998670.1 AAA family ATPase [Ochrobactrum sp. C6C9]RRD27737.1 CtpF protein [Brucellaceae bacterium VT-16-1752]WHT41402.1 CpaE family protein [Ochrobactrum sp. SSR]MDX4074000.1 CpaE family protein [Brucella sp. NBRC 113783]NNU59130.1 AAA family ATPase [[Ochrobactrum] soli]